MPCNLITCLNVSNYLYNFEYFFFKIGDVALTSLQILLISRMYLSDFPVLLIVFITFEYSTEAADAEVTEFYP